MARLTRSKLAMLLMATLALGLIATSNAHGGAKGHKVAVPNDHIHANADPAKASECPHAAAAAAAAAAKAKKEAPVQQAKDGSKPPGDLHMQPFPFPEDGLWEGDDDDDESNHGGHAHHHEGKSSSSTMKAVFAFLFPGSPMVNSLLGTTYISIIPNLLLYFVPPNIRPESLNTLVAFAVGGLLGDVFLHLLPHAFLGEVHGGDLLIVDEVKNIVVGFSIFIGFFIFFCIDKVMRVLSGGEGGHSHSHGHDHKVDSEDDQHHHHHDDDHSKKGKNDKDSGLRQRKKGDKDVKDSTNAKSEEKQPQQPTKGIKLSAYLNLIADATHNFTDGLAMAASFYTSPAIGATTTVAVFFHEIPHEVGDYAILIQSGFPRSKAMMSQFITAIGAFLGTLAGIAIEEMSKASEGSAAEDEPLALFGFKSIEMRAGELVIPFTAGGFLYIATVGVIPELLTVTGRLAKDARQFASEILAMAVGVGMMIVIALNE
ncbi:hypothetical protein DFQ27_000410 [Actinomortierella ambigua]|uniref:Uncharacterized protein n=1 Tax=Actinomortierella ambigua TaxID=1343610 RepID=A0A9P6QJA3_9FUNG|nr:hypothetical protein DFQ27_000410 [Actinomortierella ambigua]